MSARSLSMLLGLLLWPGLAVADPISAVAFLAPIIGGTAAAFVVSYAGTIAMVSLTAYSAISARNKARKRAAAARAAYNGQLQDRMVTALSIDPPKRMILGRAETGGSVVAMFTTDKALADGGVKPDAYKHLVIVWAAHQCHQIHDIKIDGVSLGNLDHVGNAAADHWDNPADDEPRSSTAPGSARSLPLPDAKGVLLVLLNVGGPNPRTEQVEGWTLAAGVLTLPNSVNGYTPGTYSEDQWEVTAIRLVGQLTNPVAPATTVRVVHHLGAADQAADSYLMGLVPTQWTAEHRLRGLCYSVVTLDLERTQFQSGPPGITADISGALVLDRRTGTTAWSNNPALLIDHWLRSEFGYGVGLADVDAASVIAAANACDAPVSFVSSSGTVTEARYTCNGVITSDTAKEVVLADLAESMAGWASYSGGWRVQAGVWAPTVMDLSDNDLAGPITIVQAGEPSSELFNGVRGQYIPAGSAVPAEFEPYQVAAFLAADGRALWTDLDLPFTNSKARAKAICRVLTEQARNGLIIHFPAQMRAWPLQAGDRVRVSSTEYGWANKAFRVTDWGFGITAPVGLTLQEDAPEAYDEADAVASDPTPNTQLPDPWVVPALGGLTLESGTAHLQKLGDGTIISRVRASWPRVTASYMNGGRVELSWRTLGSSATWIEVAADPAETSAYLAGVVDGSYIVVSAVLVNSHGARSAAIYRVHAVLGKTAPPAAVQFTGVTLKPGQARIGYQPCPDLDYSHTLLRVGSNWAAGTPLPGVGDLSGYDWAWPAIGNHTVWAVHVDSSGNASAPASVVAGVTAAIHVPGSSVVPPADWLNANQVWGNISDRPTIFDSKFERQASWNTGTLVASAGSSGGMVLQVTGSSMGLLSTEFMPVDTGRIYLSRVRARQVSGTGQFYAGIACYDASKAYIVGVPPGATYNYTACAGVTLGTAWQTFEGLIKDPVAPDSNASHFRTGTAFVKLMALCSQGGNGVVELDLLEFIDVTDAYNAANAAADAQADADAANALIADWASDGKLSPIEKQAMRKEWDGEVSAKAGINAQAAAYGIAAANTNYNTALIALGTYLNNGTAWAFSTTVPPLWISDAQLTTVTTIVGATLRATWKAYTDAKQALLNAFSAQAKALADGAQTTATNAANAAADAQADADAAIALLADWASDGKLSPQEKQAMRKEWDGEVSAKAGINAQAAAYGIAAANTNYNTALIALGTYLNNGTAWAFSATVPPLWISDAQLTTVTTIVGATLRATWKAYTDAKQALLNSIADVAGTRATWSGVSGSGKPLDNASKVIDLGDGSGPGQRGANDPPSFYSPGVTRQFKVSAAVGLGGFDNYLTLETVIQYADSSGGSCYQYAYRGTTTWRRWGVCGASSWAGGWVQDLDRNAYTGDLAATQNDVVYSSSAPSSPTQRTLWIDTSVTPRTIKMWIGSAWVLAGTYVNGTAQLTDDAQLGLTALWSGIPGGSGKPDDYATRNQVYYQDSDPGGVPEGSIWISSTKAWQRIGGAWRPYVGPGSVNTNELVPESAAKVDIFTSALVSVSGLPSSIVCIYTLPSGGIFEVTYTATARVTAFSSAGRLGLQFVTSIGGGTGQTYGNITPAFDVTALGQVININCTVTFVRGDATTWAGSVALFVDTGSWTAEVDLSTLRVTTIRR